VDKNIIVMGKNKAIETPEKLLELFNDYKDWLEENPILIEDYVGKEAYRVMRQKPRAMTMEGFECYLFNRKIINDLGDYFKNKEDRYTDFAPICLHIKKEIRANQIEGGMAGVYNPSITQRLNGLVEKQENKLEVVKPIIIDWSNNE